MSLPTSFFTFIKTGGEFSYIREWTSTASTIYQQNISRPIRYHVPTNTYVLAWQQVFYSTSQNRVGLVTIDPSTGSISSNYYYGDDLEPRSFDLFNNGQAIIAAEAGGSSYYVTTDTSRSVVSDTKRVYNGNKGNGYMYTRAVAAYDREDGNRYYIHGGNYGSGPTFVDYASPNSTPSNNIRSFPSNGTAAIIRDISVQKTSANHQDVYVCGRVDFNNQDAFVGLYGNALYNPDYIETYSSGSGYYDDYKTIVPHGSLTDTSNATNRYFYTGGRSTFSGRDYATITKQWVNGIVWQKYIRRTYDSLSANAQVNNIIYDSVNNNRIYVVGKMVKPTYDSGGRFANGVTDGFVMCFNTTASTSDPTLVWAIGIAENVNNYHNVTVRGVELDHQTGQPIITGMRNSGNANNGGLFTMKLPSDGNVSGTHGNYTFYDMSSAIEFIAVNYSASSTSDTTGSFNYQSVTRSAISNDNNNSTTFQEI